MCLYSSPVFPGLCGAFGGAVGESKFQKHNVVSLHVWCGVLQVELVAVGACLFSESAMVVHCAKQQDIMMQPCEDAHGRQYQDAQSC